MKKLFIFCLLLLGVLGLVNGSQAAASYTITNAPLIYIFPSEFDKLVFDFTITTTDTLQALTVNNLSTARDGYELTKVILWQDNGDGVFQGLARDIKIGQANFYGTRYYWYWSNLNLSLTGSTRFFISVETNDRSRITAEKGIQFRLPQLADFNSNGLFDLGDEGLFLASQDNGPSSSLVNNFTQVIRPQSGDGSVPKVVITTPLAGQTIIANDYLIHGVARDQGGSGIDVLKININGTDYIPTALEPNFASWEYNWQNITPGTYTLKMYAKDGFGNFTDNADSLSVTISQKQVDARNSSLTLDKNTIKAGGSEKATATVIVKDQDNQPLADRSLNITKSSNVNLLMLSDKTNALGEIKFELTCNQANTENITVAVESVTLGSFVLNCTSEQQQPGPGGLNVGDLTKASGGAVYYYGANGKRYVFPDEKTYKTWYPDFSTVKTISDGNLSSIIIGGNVTYKPGVKLVKITTDPKVYAVAANGTLRWLTTEAVAISLYGANWASLVQDVSDPFFVNYTIGLPINSSADYNPSAEAAAATSINADKNLL